MPSSRFSGSEHVRLQSIKVVARAAIRVFALVAAYGFAYPTLDLRSIVEAAGPYALVFAVIGLTNDMAFRADRGSWRFTSVLDILIMARNSTLTVGVLLVGIFIFDRGQSMPRSSVLLTWGLDIGLFSGLLLIRRAVHEKALTAAFAPFLSRPSEASHPLMLIGDPSAADAFLRNLARDPVAAYCPVGVITNRAQDVGQEVRHVPVLASLAKAGAILDRFMERDGERSILFLDNSTTPADVGAEQLGRLRARGVRLMRLSGIVELSEPGVRPKLQEIDVEELLARPTVKLDFSEIRGLISGRRILVTGAGGSIGSEICRQVAALGCAHIGLFDNSEFGLFNIDMEIGNNFPTLSRSDILCNVRDADRVNDWVAAEQPDIIFHAAALKHVPLMENHPCESVLTNVVGTWNIADAARANGAAHMIFISTDKAVDPGNVMGATKRLAESVVRVHRAAASSTRFSVVRFGNVLGSAGSVVPTFKAQIARGGPITLTHPDIERYFMTIPEAVQLVLHATAKSANRKHQSGVFVLDMGEPVKIMDLARRLIELHGKIPGRDIEIKITGLRPGEKLTEALVDSTEEARPCDPGVVEVNDRFDGLRIDRSFVRRLEDVARTGASAPTRQMVFEMLARVRAAPTSQLHAGA
jgi:O-antigen biosynthesis protein WbqV